MASENILIARLYSCCFPDRRARRRPGSARNQRGSGSSPSRAAAQPDLRHLFVSHGPESRAPQSSRGLGSLLLGHPAQLLPQRRRPKRRGQPHRSCPKEVMILYKVPAGPLYYEQFIISADIIAKPLPSKKPLFGLNTPYFFGLRRVGYPKATATHLGLNPIVTTISLSIPFY